MKKGRRLMLVAVSALLATAAVAAVAGARSLANPAGSSADSTATERAREGKVRASTPTLADAPIPEEPAAAVAWKPDPWDHFNPYERWVRNVPMEHTHAVR